MEDETILQSQITASSVRQEDDNRYETWQARLGNDNYWKPDSDSESWIQVTFTNATTITGILIQGAGGGDKYVEKLKIKYDANSDGSSYQTIMDQSGNEMVRNFTKCLFRRWS